MEEKYHYIKLGVGNGGYIELADKIGEDLYDNIGTTFQDYLEGKFVLLTDEQYAFHIDNPLATIKEVFEMALEPPYEPTEEEILASLKAQKLQEIEQYSHSKAVDQFTINGVIKDWLTPTERANYLQSLTSAELLGETEVDFFVGKNLFTLDLRSARLVLAKIQRYADASFIVTERKKIELDALQTADEVREFDISSGYPEQLNFDFVIESEEVIDEQEQPEEPEQPSEETDEEKSTDNEEQQ